MSQIKLSYEVAGYKDTVEVICNSHIELAAAILDMERDVGMICHNVKIAEGSFTDNRRSDCKQALREIQAYAKVLMRSPYLS